MKLFSLSEQPAWQIKGQLTVGVVGRARFILLSMKHNGNNNAPLPQPLSTCVIPVTPTPRPPAGPALLGMLLLKLV